jgi:hypothetical protein
VAWRREDASTWVGWVERGETVRWDATELKQGMQVLLSEEKGDYSFYTERKVGEKKRKRKRMNCL